MVKHAEMIDEEEHFVDVDEDETTSNDHETAQIDERTDQYDAQKRDPRFASADATCLWELVS